MKLQKNIENILAGIINGILAIFGTIALAALIFSGPMVEYLSTGIVLLLISTVVIALGGTLGSGYPGIIVSLRSATIPIFSAMAAKIAVTMAAQGREVDVLATVIAAFGITSIVTGLVLVLVGQFGLGRLVRYFPYPVAGGIFAGGGFALFTGGLSVATHQPIPWNDLAIWFSPEIIQQWASPLIFGVFLYVFKRRWNQWFVIPILLLLGFAVFYTLLWLSGQALEVAMASGWLLELSDFPTLFPVFDFGDLSRVHWLTVAGQAGSIGAVAMLCVILLLIDVTAIEIIVNRELDPNRELKVAGVANLTCGLFGGCAGVQSLPDTALFYMSGGDRRLAGFVFVACILTAVFVAINFISMFPIFIVGGLLVYIGIDFLLKWVWMARKELPSSDYIVVLLILTVCIWKGLLEGIIFGLLISVILFVINYSRLTSIRSEYTGRDRISHIERDPEIREILDHESDCILIMEVQGALFFGTAGDLMGIIREKLTSPEELKLKYLILDLKHVVFMDASGVTLFSRLAQVTENYGVSVVITGHDERMGKQLEGIAFFTKPTSRVHRCQFSQLNEGIAYCEDRILDDCKASRLVGTDTLEGRLSKMLRDEDAARRIVPFFQRQEHAEGNWLFRRGDLGDSLYIVDSGTVSVVVDAAYGGEHVVCVYTSGAILGEMAVYMEGPRTASVRIETSSVLYRLDAEGLQHLQLRHPEAAGRFHAAIVKMIAARLDRSTRELRHHL